MYKPQFSMLPVYKNSIVNTLRKQRVILVVISYNFVYATIRNEGTHQDEASSHIEIVTF